jgi:threonine/homoserine/homoserine lactone efflux protein
MSTSQFLLYIFVASLTIASPGPGVILTITNSIKYGFKYSVLGVFGIALGMLFISILAGSGLGALLLASPYLFTAIKYLGAFYLAYLAWRLWYSKEVSLDSDKLSREGLSPKGRFKQAFILTLSNPKAIVFFTALFPQFIDAHSSYLDQFLFLSITFCLLIVIIHLVYAAFSTYLGKFFVKSGNFNLINKISSVFFMVFSLALIKSALTKN